MVPFHRAGLISAARAAIPLILSGPMSLFVQGEPGATGPRPARVGVPFVGCRSDGQAGPREAPQHSGVSVPISPAEAKQLAWYSSAGGIGALAPRGWYCHGVYGSGGDVLLVSPQPIALSLDNWSGSTGPAVVVSRRSGQTIGRFDVAEIIDRAFPEYADFAVEVRKYFLSEEQFRPYPTDTLIRRSKSVVEYRTPAQADGLGTRFSRLRQNDSPIEGAAILIGQTPDLVLLSVRLPAELRRLTSTIIRQVEVDAERSPRFWSPAGQRGDEKVYRAPQFWPNARAGHEADDEGDRLNLPWVAHLPLHTSP